MRDGNGEGRMRTFLLTFINLEGYVKILGRGQIRQKYINRNKICQ